MMKRNYLLEHAIKNVWCSPKQDNQLVISGPIVCRSAGALNYVSIYDRNIPMPSKGERYYVYNLGQLNPSMVGLLSNGLEDYNDIWVNIADTISTNKIWLDICMENGISLPRHTSYYMFTREHGLVIATKLNSKINIDERVYLRAYSNAYFQSTESDQVTDIMYCYGVTITSIEVIMALEAKLREYQSRQGVIFYYCNGLNVGKLDLLSLSLGDIVEFVFDSSIKQTLEIKFDDLDEFISSLDQKHKYLLHHVDLSNDTINYFDDIDIFVLTKDTKFSFTGLYYLKSAQDSMRMVTHRDYSVPVSYAVKLRDNLTQFITDRKTHSPDDYIRICIHKAGLTRPLILEKQRVFELYKLDDSKVVQALVGVNSVVGEWSAANLENSYYTKFMSAKEADLNIELVTSMYGYHAASVYLGQTPSKTTLKSSRQSADLPYTLTADATVYEYDVDGYLLGYHYHAYGSDYEARNINTRLIEGIAGKGSPTPEVYFGTDNLDIPLGCSYRVYMCYIGTDGKPNNIWSDITNSNLYIIVNNKLLWANLEISQYLMIRTDRTFLAYNVDIQSIDGVSFFTLAEYENRDGLSKLYTLPVPLGDLDIWVNGKALIKDYGYFVDFPKVYIVDKECLKQPVGSPQTVTVRFSGFCDKFLNLNIADDQGFIEHGFLSNNNRYDIRDDKVLRIIVDGKTIHRDDLLFSEDHDGVGINHPSNGKPYQIKDLIVPMFGITGLDTHEYKASSEIVDVRVANYITVKDPQAAREGIMTITNRYHVYSPFTCSIIYNMINGHFPNSEIYKAWDINKLIELCRPYEYLLKYEHLRLTESNDLKYIIVTPHSSDTYLGLNVNQFTFLKEVIKIYFDNEIDLTNFVRITSSTPI